MRESFISVTGVSKSFERSVIPSTLLQDHLLKWGRHKRRVRIDALNNIQLSDLKIGTDIVKKLPSTLRPDQSAILNALKFRLPSLVKPVA